MTDPRHRTFRLWPWRRQSATTTTITTPPAAPELATKLIELMHFERWVAALHYYLPDESLAVLAPQNLCCHPAVAHTSLDHGIDRELRTKDATLAAWRTVTAIWHSTIWQPGEILPTFGFRLIEALRAEMSCGGHGRIHQAHLRLGGDHRRDAPLLVGPGRRSEGRGDGRRHHDGGALVSYAWHS